MRNNPTFQEGLLWEKLRLKRLNGFRFRQQGIIRGFIADFYCPKCSLVVEIDGKIHLGTAAYDQMRDNKFSSLGILTLRFSNKQVEEEMDYVLKEISSACCARMK